MHWSEGLGPAEGTEQMRSAQRLQLALLKRGSTWLLHSAQHCMVLPLGQTKQAALTDPSPPAHELQVRREMAGGMGPNAGAISPLPAFNGNVITPGTAFMARLSDHLRAFLARQLAAAGSGDPDWGRLLVRKTTTPGRPCSWQAFRTWQQ